MSLPSKLKNMDLFIDGASFLCRAPEVTVPKLAIKMEEYQGGGMLAPVDIAMGLEKLEMEFTLGGLEEQAMRSFGSTRVDALGLRFAGGYQDDSTGRVKAAEVYTRGRYSEIDMGGAKQGDDTEHKFKASLVYYKLNVDGRNIITVDKLNYIFIVNGVDRYAELRAAIGR